jgi:hypothetical protein
MSNIFISYSSKDRARVLPIVARLMAKGWSVYWDRKLKPSERYARIIQDELVAADCVLVIWSKESVLSDWVLDEADKGKRRNVLVPASIDAVEIPLGFGRIHAANLIGWSGSESDPEFEALEAAISRFVGTPERANPEPEPVKPGDKIVERAWPSPSPRFSDGVFPADDQAEADVAWRDMYDRNELPRDKSQETGEQFWKRKGEFWFDYVANTGDDTVSTYGVAYLCLSNLWMRELWEAKPTDSDAVLRLDHDVNDNQTNLVKLPRGEFLTVGWNSIPYMSYFADLHSRFQVPFKHAYHDLEQDLKAVGKSIDNEESQKTGRNRRPLFGILSHRANSVPESFRKQFLAPLKRQSENTNYLMRSGFKKHQKARYLVLRLPFSWMFWGLHLDWVGVDEEQAEFFAATNGRTMPDKLIVAAGPPMAAFGKYAPDCAVVRAFRRLKLPQPLLGKDSLDDEMRERLMPEQIRLDLTSEVHQYARYWGPNAEQSLRVDRVKDEAPSATNYASVVSGLGDAFHDPSTADAGEIKEQALYPPAKSSRDEIAAKLFNPLTVAKTPIIWMLGATIAVICTFATIANRSSSQAIHNFKPLTSLGISEPERYDSIGMSPEDAMKEQRDIRATGLTQVLMDLGFVKSWRPEPSTDPDCNVQEQFGRPVYFWGKCRVEWPADYSLGFWLILLSGPTLMLAFLRTRQHYFAFLRSEEVKPSTKEPKERFNNTTRIQRLNWTIWGFTLVITLMAGLGVLLVLPYRSFITSFGNSLLLFLTLIWAASSLFAGFRHSQWLREEGERRRVHQSEWVITLVLACTALISFFGGIILFGKTNVPSNLVFDVLFVGSVNATILGLLYMAMARGSTSLNMQSKMWMLLVGIWHSLLQIGMAWFLIIKGTWLTVVSSMVLVYAFSRVGKSLWLANRRGGLILAWVVFGVLMLALPPFIYDALKHYSTGPEVMFWPHHISVHSDLAFSQYQWWGSWQGWWQLVPIGLAGIFGAFLSCVWLSWYLAVSEGFGGHTREIGRIARVQRFKQFIRFRLRENDLTAYVIAVDEPKENGRDLTPKLIDVFRLRKDEKNPV